MQSRDPIESLLAAELGINGKRLTLSDQNSIDSQPEMSTTPQPASPQPQQPPVDNSTQGMSQGQQPLAQVGINIFWSQDGLTIKLSNPNTNVNFVSDNPHQPQPQPVVQPQQNVDPTSNVELSSSNGSGATTHYPPGTTPAPTYPPQGAPQPQAQTYPQPPIEVVQPEVQPQVEVLPDPAQQTNGNSVVQPVQPAPATNDSRGGEGRVATPADIDQQLFAEATTEAEKMYPGLTGQTVKLAAIALYNRKIKERQSNN